MTASERKAKYVRGKRSRGECGYSGCKAASKGYYCEPHKEAHKVSRHQRGSGLKPFESRASIDDNPSSYTKPKECDHEWGNHRQSSAQMAVISKCRLCGAGKVTSYEELRRDRAMMAAWKGFR